MKKVSEAALEEQKLKVEKQLAEAAKKRKEIIRLQRELRERREEAARCVIGEMVIKIVGDGSWCNIDYEKLFYHIQENKATMAMDFLTPKTLEAEVAVLQLEAVRDILAESSTHNPGEEDAICGA